MSYEEKVLVPDLLGRIDDPNIVSELKNFKPPSPHKKQTWRRVQTVCYWVMRTGWVGPEEVVDFATRKFNMSEGAVRKTVLPEVVKRLDKIGKVKK